MDGRSWGITVVIGGVSERRTLARDDVRAFVLLVTPNCRIICRVGIYGPD